MSKHIAKMTNVQTKEDSILDTTQPEYSESTVQCESKEHTPLLDSSTHVYSYRRRWYVLFVFSLANFVQAGVWNTYGPIAQSAKLVFGWTDANIGMLANWANLSTVIVLLPVAWLMDVKGLRISMVSCCLIILLGMVLKCITSDPDIATWLINISCIIHGIGGAVPFAGPALFSATWFPPNQRATATAISTVSSYSGIAVTFILGPLIVPEPPDITIHMTDILTENCSSLITNNTFIYNTSLPLDIRPQRDAIMRLMYIECGVVGILFLMVLVYFPNRPPTPPSFTASIERTSYMKGLKRLIRHKRFLIILLAYSIPTGVFGVFGAVLDVILKGINVSQDSAGWIGFYSTIAGCAAGLFVSRIADVFLRRMKLMLIVCFILATLSTAWLVALRLGYISFDIASVYASSILAGVFINGAIPLFFELACEASYPIGEGITASTLALWNNLTGILFLSVLQIPDIGVLWMSWALLGSVAVTIPLLLIFQEKYTRTDLDITRNITTSPLDMENKALR